MLLSQLAMLENMKQLDMLQHEGKMESIKNDHEVNLKRMLNDDKKCSQQKK